MEQNTELLNHVYQNSQMGIDTISQIKEIVDDKEFCSYLDSQEKEYLNINDEARTRLHEAGVEERGIGNMAKASANMSIGMKTLTDKTPSHISEMLIKGSTKGVVEATKNLEKYDDADKNIIALNKKLLKTEQNNIDQLKKFL